MKRAKFITSAILLSYAITAFLCWDYNPAYWSGLGRMTFLALMISSVFLACLLTIRMNAVNDFIEQREKREAESNRKAGGFKAALQRQLDAAEEARKKAK